MLLLFWRSLVVSDAERCVLILSILSLKMLLQLTFHIREFFGCILFVAFKCVLLLGALVLRWAHLVWTVRMGVWRVQLLIISWFLSHNSGQFQVFRDIILFASILGREVLIGVVGSVRVGDGQHEIRFEVIYWGGWHYSILFSQTHRRGICYLRRRILLILLVRTVVILLEQFFTAT